MKRFSLVFLLMALTGLIFSSQVGAELSIFGSFTDPGPASTELTLRPEEAVEPELLAQAQQTLSRRLAQLRLDGYYQVEVTNPHLTVRLPTQENMAYMVDLLTRPGRIEFVAAAAGPPLGQYLNEASATESLFNGQEIRSVIPPESDSGQLFYQVALQPEAAQRLTRFLDSQPQPYLCLVIDQEVINCSKMYHWADDTLNILPDLSSGTHFSLADLGPFLSGGPLPVALEVVE